MPPLFFGPISNITPPFCSHFKCHTSPNSRALRAPSTTAVDLIKAEYGPLTAAYLNKFLSGELYRAYSTGLEDGIVTSQGAESAMNAALVNKVRRVEPMAMLRLVAESQCRKFNEQKVVRSVPS